MSINNISDEENERFFRYSLRRYESFGPTFLKKALFDLRDKMVYDNIMDEFAFWELCRDLTENNNWDNAHILAYFETYNLEKNT